ncbi:aminotransferase-like domain-containing protein [Mailhella sp.]|uniref:aminotransferase-like domain-containing protein n=1 Tax=Mailhella sp. TaxID=1981029 RepID=UPI0040630E54
MTLDIVKSLYEKVGARCRYQRIAEALADGIAEGRLKPGDTLPAQRTLAAALNITPGTVIRGYTVAARKGLISGAVGRGTFVAFRRPDVDILPPLEAPALPSFSVPEEQERAYRFEPEEGIRWNLGFIAPFEHLNPSLADALAALPLRMDARELAELQSYHRPAGMVRHRKAGAAWAKRYGVPVSHEDLLVCAGSQHALLVLLTSLCRAGDHIAADPLSYPLLRQLAWRLGLRVAPIRTDSFGMLPDALDNACRSGGIRAVYLMPSCRNPTLTRMPENRRRELTEVCRRHDILIIEDDVYALALSGIEGTPAGTPFAVLAPERTCFIAATSEILGGGLRVAYLCPPQQYLEQLEHTISYTISMVPPLMAELAAQWINDGTADSILRTKREEAAARNALAREIFDGSPLVSRSTGFFCWLPLPDSWTGMRFTDEARQRGILVAEGEHFRMGHDMPENGVRLALGGVQSRKELTAALQTLRNMLEGRE